MPEVRIPACAKINLRLEILGKRPDGFHELRTIFQTIGLKDELHLKSTHEPEISVRVLGNDSLSGEPIEKIWSIAPLTPSERNWARKMVSRSRLRKPFPPAAGWVVAPAMLPRR